MTTDSNTYQSLLQEYSLPAGHDGVVLLGNPESAGACSEALPAWIASLGQGLPVLLAQPETPASCVGKHCPALADAVVSLCTEPGPAQGHALMQALHGLNIRAPVLLLTNPDYIPLARRMFATARVFAVTPQFRESPPSFARPERPFFDADPLMLERSLFFDRCMDLLLYEAGEDLEWMEATYAFFGQSLQLPASRQQCEEAFAACTARPRTKSMLFPHRLEVLVLRHDGGGSEAAQAPGGRALEYFCRHSRHRVQRARLTGAPEEPGASEDGVDLSAFDAVILDGQATTLDPDAFPARYRAAIAAFTGLKACLADEPADIASAPLLAPGRVLRLDARLMERRMDNRQLLLDALLNELMPGVPNWQVQRDRRFIANHAWSDRSLAAMPSPALPRHARLDDMIAGLLETEADMAAGLEAMRKEIAALEKAIAARAKAPTQQPAQGLAALKQALRARAGRLSRLWHAGKAD